MKRSFWTFYWDEYRPFLVGALMLLTVLGIVAVFFSISSQTAGRMRADYMRLAERGSAVEGKINAMTRGVIPAGKVGGTSGFYSVQIEYRDPFGVEGLLYEKWAAEDGAGLNVSDPVKVLYLEDNRYVRAASVKDIRFKDGAAGGPQL
jgi:hypothetical protein